MEFGVTISLILGHGHKKWLQKKLSLNHSRIRAMVLYRQYYSGINVNDSVDFHGHPKQTFSLICVA